MYYCNAIFPECVVFIMTSLNAHDNFTTLGVFTTNRKGGNRVLIVIVVPVKPPGTAEETALYF